MRKIRLLVDAHVFDDGFQGTRRFLRGLYTQLVNDDRFQVFLAARDIELLQSEFGTGPHYLRLKSTSSVSRLVFEWPRLIRKYRIDYAHFQYIVPPVKNCFFIVTTHDVLFNNFPERFSSFYRLQKNYLYRRGAVKADLLSTVSTYSSIAIRQHLRISKKQIHLLPNAVEPCFFEKYDKPQCRKQVSSRFGVDRYILYVARIEPRKNHLRLINAFLRAELNNTSLVMVGDETLPVPGLKERLLSLSASERKKLHFLSGIPEAELLLLYRGADAFVYPSEAEGFGIPPLEAAAARIPVICSASTAMASYDFFGNGLFDPFNEEELVQKLQNVIQHPPGQFRLDEIARIVQQRFNWQSTATVLAQSIVSHHQKIQHHDPA